jgi:hypothetical protein
MEQIQQLAIDKSQIDIQFSVLENMIGYAPGQMGTYEKQQLKEVFELIKSRSNLQAGYLILEPRFDQVSKSIQLVDAQLAVESIIFAQLKNAGQIVFMACTIGQQLEVIVQEFRNKKDFLSEYFSDIIGSAYVESLADYVHKYIESEMKSAGLNITNRFSPGYCGWEVDEQKNLFNLAPSGFCGITLTDSALMQPMKSVSAILGVGKEVKWKNYHCNKCEKESCLYRETQKLI